MSTPVESHVGRFPIPGSFQLALCEKWLRPAADGREKAAE